MWTPSEPRTREAPRPTSGRGSTVWGRNCVVTAVAPGFCEPHAASSNPSANATDKTLLDTAAHILAAARSAGFRRRAGRPAGAYRGRSGLRGGRHALAARGSGLALDAQHVGPEPA